MMRRGAALAVLTLLAAAPLSAAQVERLAAWDGETSGEQYGIVVALGRDADGDGWADLAVGSPTSDEAGENAGKVSVYLGGLVPPTAAGLELFGPPGSFFGSALAWAGDVNGDGFDDLLVGAYRDSTAGLNAGRAFLFLGGNPMNAMPALTLTGPAPGAYFGRAVSGAGNLNGDLYDDFAVGAPRTAKGEVYVFFGGDPPSAVPSATLFGEAVGDRFGSSIAGVGNADLIPGDDLLVGAPRASELRTWQGSAYLFSGGASFGSAADWEARGPDAGEEFGTSVAAAGDVNGDGVPDLLVGAPYRNVLNLTDAGMAYLFYGGGAIATAADFTIAGLSAEQNLGRSVAGCGDVTDIGFGHVVVGAPGAGTSGNELGRAVLVPGGNPPNPAGFIFIDGETASDAFSYSVSGLPGGPSFTGLGQPDFAAGAWGYGIGGRGYVYGLPSITAVGRNPVAAQPPPMVSPNPGSTFVLSFEGVREPTHAFIVSVDGRIVRRLAIPASRGAAGSVVWDGTTDDGRLASPGVYFIATPSAGGKKMGGRLVLVR